MILRGQRSVKGGSEFIQRSCPGGPRVWGKHHTSSYRGEKAGTASIRWQFGVESSWPFSQNLFAIKVDGSVMDSIKACAAPTGVSSSKG